MKMYKLWFCTIFLIMTGFSSAGMASLILQQLKPSVTYLYDDKIKTSDFDYSFIVSKELLTASRKTNNSPIVPAFAVSGSFYSVSIPVEKGTSLYGTGEVPGRLLRNGTKVIAWNTDAYAYNRRKQSLYQSFPWVLAVRADGTSFGILADTTRACEIDLTAGIKFSVDGKPFPVIVITGRSPQEVLSRLSELIGRTPLPPKWALGYQQCRWSYESETIVTNIALTFRAKHIPCDVIWMDIDYMDGFRIFTFNKTTFPDPRRLNTLLHTRNFKSIWMIDPGVKIDDQYFVYNEGTKKNAWVKDKSGQAYQGNVWPGPCVFPDFTSPRAREWWASLYKNFLDLGVDGVWNDMNEPSVFNTPTGTMPLDNRHEGGDKIPSGTHGQFHNVYGMLMVQSTFAGILKAQPDKRPFVLSRANYIGGNKYAACWTGDNIADWEHLEDSVSMSLNLGLSGQPFSGPDIGGFASNGDDEIYAKWIAVGALLPFSRGHAAKGTRQKEPWTFGPQVEDIARVALQRRYRLLPYLYTVFHETSLTGLPVIRPIFFTDPADSDLRSEDKVYLIGDNLLVVPYITESSTALTLPKGIWLPLILIDREKEKDGKQPELRIKGGTIIPIGKIIESTEETSLDPLTLVVCLNERGEAEGSLYEDAGNGFGYQKGDYLLTTYKAVLKEGKMDVRIIKEEGKRVRPKRKTAVMVVAQNGNVIQGEGDEKVGISFNCNLPLPVSLRTNSIIYDKGAMFQPIPSAGIACDMNGKIITGFKGEYYNNKDWSGSPSLTTNNREISFNWGTGAPYPAIGKDDFSVRWTGTLTPPSSGKYSFKLSSDDGSKLLINDKVVVDNSGPHGVKTEYGNVDFEKGKKVKIVLEFVEFSGEASCDLKWRIPEEAGNSK